MPGILLLVSGSRKEKRFIQGIWLVYPRVAPTLHVGAPKA